ncbi:MAG: DUF3795 domain-containing protein [Actinobacteria bacterium]|nr:DUF3795 domain-containing protein [Actinomycetota bacterium]MCG2806859.1 DUF3795 domain-containing protein [Coriobacteriia bacterium]
MGVEETIYPDSLRAVMIAPCGMNCGLCIGHLREKNRCGGCNVDNTNKPKHCVVCRIKNCDETKTGETGLCFECSKFPCARMRQLDKRYRTKYGMSMLENLERVRELGVEGFLGMEKERWTCPECGGVICVHREACIYCGHARS